MLIVMIDIRLRFGQKLPVRHKRSDATKIIPCADARRHFARAVLSRRRSARRRAPRDQVLLAVMGSPHSPDRRHRRRRPLTSKVAIVSRSTQPGRRRRLPVRAGRIGKPSSTRAELRQHAGRASGRSRSRPAWSRRGRRDPGDDLQRQHRGADRGDRADAGRRCDYDGDARIDGVPGTAAPIVLNFMDVVGSVAGKLLPTGDVIDGITLEVTSSTSRCR